MDVDVDISVKRKRKENSEIKQHIYAVHTTKYTPYKQFMER